MKILVNAHKCEIVKTPVNEKEINVTKCEFEFSEEITDSYVKDVYFTSNEETIKVANIQNNECDIPYEVLIHKGMVEIGVVAYLVENEQEIKRYNPSPVFIDTWVGSLKDNFDNYEEITPTDKEQLEQELNDGLQEINEAVSTITTAVEQANTLDLDVSKSGKIATVELTKKDGTVKTVTLSDGTNLMFQWDGTSLGIKTDDDADYTYVNLQGIQGEQGPMGAPFTIKKTYSSIAEMNADFNNMNVGDYVMIASTVEVEDNAKLYTKGEEAWIFITDFSGATGIQGPTGATPNIQIGTVTSGETPSVTRSGSNENPVLNFTLVKGDKGDTGATGATGVTGNGIASITKTSTNGYVDTYTITYTNGNTTTFTVTNGEVTLEQLNYYRTIENALPKVTGTGTSITMNNTAESPMRMELEPSELEQATTTGIQLLNMSDATNGYFTSNSGTVNASTSGFHTNTFIDVGENTKIYLRFEALEAIRIGRFWIQEFDENQTSFNRHQSAIYDTTFTKGQVRKSNMNLTEGTKYIKLSCYTLQELVNDSYVEKTPAKDEWNNYVKATISFEDTDIYEEYTGMKPSPNPSYPQDIHVITGDNSIKIEGKNLFDKTTCLFTDKRRYKDDGTIGIDNDASYSDLISVSPNTTYTISNANGIPGKAVRCTYFDENRDFIQRTSPYSTNNMTVTTTNDTYYLSIQGRNLDNMNINTIQLEENNQATTYRSYQSQTYPITLGSLEYCKIGNYSDKFFKNTIDSEDYDSTLELNKWYLKKNIGKVNFADYPSYWLARNIYTNTVRLDADILINSKAINENKIITDCFTSIYGDTSDTEHARSSDSRYPTTIVIYINKSRIENPTTTAEAQTNFRSWLLTNDVIVYYVLATPTYTLLNDTLQAQLDNLQYALSYQIQTNISQTNQDLPFIINSKAIRDISNIFDLISGE